MNAKQVLKEVVKICDDKQAQDIVALDMDKISLVADYFVICHANNSRQVQAIARAIKNGLEEQGLEIKHLEGLDQSKWVVVDTGYVLCHIFEEEERSFYNLERLWGDAPQVPLELDQGN